MSTSRRSTTRDKKGRIPIPDSATKPFPRVHSRYRNSADENRHEDEEEDRRTNSGRVKGDVSREVDTKGAGRRDSSSSSDSDGRSGRVRARSPIECQCSCHTESGRRRSPSRDARRGRSNSADRRSSLDSIHNRYGESAFSDPSDSRANSGDGHNRDGYNSGGGSDRDDDDRRNDDDDGRGGDENDDDDDRRNRMPPININVSETKKKGKGGFSRNSREPGSLYRPRVDSKTSHLSVTSVNSRRGGGGGKDNKEPFRYYGRSHSAGSVTSYGGTSQYDYAHEDFLTPRFTSEYQARYEMRHGQRYKVQPDKSIHYIDPAGEHILIPKGDGKQLMPRRNSDSDITKNTMNVRLQPLNAKRSTDPNQGGAKKWVGNSTHVDQGGTRVRPGAEGKVVAPTGGGPPKRPSIHSLPPMQRTPSLPKASDGGKAMSAREEPVHPLGLGSTPKRRSQLQPM